MGVAKDELTGVFSNRIGNFGEFLAVTAKVDASVFSLELDPLLANRIMGDWLSDNLGTILRPGEASTGDSFSPKDFFDLLSLIGEPASDIGFGVAGFFCLHLNK